MPGKQMPDPGEFEALYTAYFPRIVRYLTRMVGPDGAEDLAQEVFIKISRSLGEFRGESSISTWIYRIATNAALDRLRSVEHRTPFSVVSPCEEGDAVAPDPGDSAEQRVIRGEMSECVRSLVDDLPESYRTVLVLSEVEGLKDAEIVDVLGVTLETVKIRLHRARARLRKRMAEQCSFYRDRESTLLCDRRGPSPDS